MSADVYRAYEPHLDRHVALKLFKAGTASNTERRANMLREARALARVRHENVVQVHGADEIDGIVGIWMELVAGRTLEAEIREHGRWSDRDAAAAGQELCRALTAVHTAGFVHGDVKAQNVARARQRPTDPHGLRRGHLAAAERPAMTVWRRRCIFRRRC